MNYSPDRLRFRVSGGVGRGLDSVTGPKSVRGNWPLWPPGVSRGLPWPPVDDGTDNTYSSKVSNTALGPQSNVKVFRP